MRYDPAQEKRLAFPFLPLAPRIVVLNSPRDFSFDDLPPERHQHDLGNTGQNGLWTALESTSRRIRALQIRRLKDEDPY